MFRNKGNANLRKRLRRKKMTKINSVMRNLFAFGLVLTLAMSVVGCGQSAEVESIEQAAQIEDEEVAMAVETSEVVANEDGVYNDANGWSVRYNPEVIQVNQGGNVTTFVYTGDCAGTCMITATYTAGDGAEAAIKALGESWGSDTVFSESVFPGTEDVTSYYAMLPPSEEGSGLVMTALGRDYMEGSLIFEFTVHNCGDDSIDIPVSDALAEIIDSIQF